MLKKPLAFLVGVVVFALTTAAGLTVATSAGTIGIGASYDMPPAQTTAFVGAAAKKLEWTVGSEPGTFVAPLLPWSTATVAVRVSPMGAGSKVELSGHATKVKELDALLRRQLPPLR